MAQVISGLLLGNRVFHFFGSGAPSASINPDVLYTAGVGSIYSQTDAADASHVLWACSVAGIPPVGSSAGIAAMWTNITVP